MGWQAVGLAATIFIRSYNNFGVPAADLAAARQDAQAVLQQAGVNIVWADCWVGDRQPASAPARCQEPVGGDIVLRLQKTGEAGRSRFVSMGFSLVGTAGAAPFLRPCMSIASSRWPEGPASMHAGCSGWRLRTRSAMCCSTAIRTRQAD